MRRKTRIWQGFSLFFSRIQQNKNVQNGQTESYKKYIRDTVECKEHAGFVVMGELHPHSDRDTLSTTFEPKRYRERRRTVTGFWETQIVIHLYSCK